MYTHRDIEWKEVLSLDFQPGHWAMVTFDLGLTINSLQRNEWFIVRPSAQCTHTHTHTQRLFRSLRQLTVIYGNRSICNRFRHTTTWLLSLSINFMRAYIAYHAISLSSISLNREKSKSIESIQNVSTSILSAFSLGTPIFFFAPIYSNWCWNACTRRKPVKEIEREKNPKKLVFFLSIHFQNV